MVVGLVFFALVYLTLVALAAYVGALRALEVYHDPHQDSHFLSDDAGPRERR